MSVSAYRSHPVPGPGGTDGTPGRWFGLAGWVLLTFAAAAVGGIGSAGAPAFYAQLVKPAWAPPAWLFGPAWTLLYTLMAVAAWQVWRERRRVPVRAALAVYVVQLVANALWSWLFFADQRGAASLADVTLLWLLLVASVGLFWRVRPLAGALLLPSLAWVSFAAALNVSVVMLNPRLL